MEWNYLFMLWDKTCLLIRRGELQFQLIYCLIKEIRIKEEQMEWNYLFVLWDKTCLLICSDKLQFQRFYFLIR